MVTRDARPESITAVLLPKCRENVSPPTSLLRLVLTYPKLDFTLLEKPRTPSSRPSHHLVVGTILSRPASAQALRKSRASACSPPSSELLPVRLASPHDEGETSILYDDTDDYFPEYDTPFAANVNKSPR